MKVVFRRAFSHCVGSGCGYRGRISWMRQSKRRKVEVGGVRLSGEEVERDAVRMKNTMSM